MMKKLSLDLGALRVETFSTDRATGARGTVHGHATPVSACRTCETQEQTCDPLCEMTSVGSCPDTNCCPTFLATDC